MNGKVPRSPLHTRARGFTLVELLIAMSILTILVAIAVPNLSGFLTRNRISGATNELLTALTLARGEAATRGVPVTLRRTSATSRDWSNGWELFVDVNGDGVRDVSPGSPEVLLRQGATLTAPMTLFSSLAAADMIQFRANGRVIPSAAGTALFMLCNDGVIVENTQMRARAVIVSDSGRIRVAAANASGYPVNDLGVAVNSCTNPS